MEIWIPVIVAIVGSLFSYFGAVSKSKNDLKNLKEQHALDLEKSDKQHRLDLERLEKEQKHEMEKMRSEAEMYEQNKQTDLIANMFESPGMQGVFQELLAQEFAASGKKNKNRR